MPKLNDDLIQFMVRSVAEYISEQRTAFSGDAMRLSVDQISAVEPFFDDELLQATRVVILTDRRVENPSFYPLLLENVGFKIPDFSTMSAITFGDVVVSHGPLPDEALFHELVHAEQYRQLGVPRFAESYVRGFLKEGSYYGIPLELNAYELEKRFGTDRAHSFSVASEVREWIDEGRF
jgi:hypothetical protein